jgi:hypothetical protein
MHSPEELAARKLRDDAFIDFIRRLSVLISKNRPLITVTLSNIFTMRLIGNKTHGDMAEIAVSEFINQYMYDFEAVHVGKDLFRAKEREEDVKIKNIISKQEFPISIKAYGDGPLQLSTDKASAMFPFLQKQMLPTKDPKVIDAIFTDIAFKDFGNVSVLPLIYREVAQKCNIMIFDFVKARANTKKIILEVAVEKSAGGKKKGKGRVHPVIKFLDANDRYICEVRYGDAKANALQRGLWTHTKNATDYFTSVTDGWIDYSHNLVLVTMFSHAFLSTEDGHAKALELLKVDIAAQKKHSTLGARPS